MGKGGKNVRSAAAPSIAATKKSSNDWVSPFTADRVDPRVGKKETLITFPTKSELRAVIPDHCFERSLFWSMAFVIRDILQGCFVVYVVHNVLEMSTDPPADGGIYAWIIWRLSWNLYAGIMGLALSGLWVIGHECGHGAFSEYPVVNGAVGWTLHSILLVPYFSWAFSHAKHHRRTNDMIEGETHMPVEPTKIGLTENQERVPTEEVEKQMFGGGLRQFANKIFYWHAKFQEVIGDEAFAVFMMWSSFLFYCPLYLFGVTGRGKIGADGKPIPDDQIVDHLRPTSRLFPEKMYWKVVASNVGCLLVLGACAYFSSIYGFRAVWFWYFGPYLVITGGLIAVTQLHHTHETVPQFDPDNWTWMKGVIAGTIDRPHDWVFNTATHNIGSTHVLHHLFHTIPHYHAVEATECLRAYLEPKGLYNFDPTPGWKALNEIGKNCHFVDSNTNGVQYYKSLKDVPRTTESSKKVQ